MVHSFDMTTNTLFTIGGNDGGYEVDTRATHAAPRGETDPEREKREQLEGATGQPLRPGSRGGHVGVGSFDLDDQPAGATLDRDRARAVARGRRLVRIYGIGRPSIVDMEDHRYDSTSGRRAPAAAPARRSIRASVIVSRRCAPPRHGGALAKFEGRATRAPPRMRQLDRDRVAQAAKRSRD